MSDFNCCVLACIQVSRETGKVAWHSLLLKRFPQFVVIHTAKVFSIVSEAEVYIFWGNFLFYDPTDVGNLISGSSAFSKSSLYIWKFLVHVLLKPSLDNFEYYLASMWNECNCMIVWTFFGIAFLWDWNENGPFSFLCPLWSFPNLLAYWVLHFNTIIFWIWNSSAGIPSLPLALFVVIILPKANLTSHSRMSGSRWMTTPSLLSGSLRPFFCIVLLCILAISS